MGKHKIRHLVPKNGRYFFQPSKALREAGYQPEPLGKDLAAAIARAEELNAEWDNRHKDKEETRLASPGTVERYIQDIKKSGSYLDKSAARQAEFDYTSAIIIETFGPSQMKVVKPRHCQIFYDNLKKLYGDHKAHRVMKDLRFVFNHAVKFGVLFTNPALAFTVKAPAPRKQSWTPEQVHTAITVGWEKGYHGAAVAIAIMYDTGMSPVDARTLEMGNLDDNKIIDSREKTGVSFSGELWPETMEWIKAYHDMLGIASTPSALVIRTRTGQPYTKDLLAKDIRTVRRLAGLPDDLQARDLRRTATIEEYEGGASEKQVAAARGWSTKTSARMSDVYGPGNFNMAKGAKDARKKNLSGPKVGISQD